MAGIHHRVRQATWLFILLVGLDVPAVGAQTQIRAITDNPVTISFEAGASRDVGPSARSQADIIANAGSSHAPPIQLSTDGPVAQAPREAEPTAHRPVELLGFGYLGYGTWFARETFNALTGSSGAPMFGGGVRVLIRSRWFIDGAIERVEKTGQRVFVSNGQVFSLGIPDTFRVVPIFATVGYRHEGRKIIPYVGGGVGTYLYKETSDFADPSENVDEHFVSYHALAGVEVYRYKWLRAAVEVQVTTVPHALGASGASAAFDQRNLGGVQFRFKVLAGR